MQNQTDLLYYGLVFCLLFFHIDCFTCKLSQYVLHQVQKQVMTTFLPLLSLFQDFLMLSQIAADGMPIRVFHGVMYSITSACCSRANALVRGEKMFQQSIIQYLVLPSIDQQMSLNFGPLVDFFFPTF